MRWFVRALNRPERWASWSGGNAGAQVALATARRDRIVAGYQLVAAIGRMTAADLRLSVNIYEPKQNLEEVRDKAFGARINTSD